VITPTAPGWLYYAISKEWKNNKISKEADLAAASFEILIPLIYCVDSFNL
jgi:hypothetical protein